MLHLFWRRLCSNDICTHRRKEHCNSTLSTCNDFNLLRLSYDNMLYSVYICLGHLRFFAFWLLPCLVIFLNIFFRNGYSHGRSNRKCDRITEAERHVWEYTYYIHSWCRFLKIKQFNKVKCRTLCVITLTVIDFENCFQMNHHYSTLGSSCWA